MKPQNPYKNILPSLVWFVTIFTLFIFLLIPTTSKSCTIFYIYSNGKVIAGSNEDWKDPLSKIFIYPAENDHYAWIKFGWGSGFPQAGMNEMGLFWDATAASYLDMPHSEQNKQYYDGPIMQKIIEECSNIEEVMQVLEQYYCEDQYRAQYLIGDAQGKSIVVEGDNILHNDKGYQVLTNFYQSHYQEGNYPCWRYNSANELIKNMDSLTEYFAGTILASTHQEGTYPTQYSNIFDLKEKKIYLFHYHNFQEFVEIDLKNEVKKGYRSYDIPKLFSQIELIAPTDGALVDRSSVNIKWSGKVNCEYEIIYSKDPNFAQSQSKIVQSVIRCYSHASTPVFLTIIAMLSMGFLTKRKWRVKALLFLLPFWGLNACTKENIKAVDFQSGSEIHSFSTAIGSLDPNTTYYWKIVASPNNSNNFHSETITKYFVTSE